MILHDRLSRLAAEEGIQPKTLVERWTIEILTHERRGGHVSNAAPFLGNYGE